MTQNLEERLRKHNEGATKSTKPYRPFTKIVTLCKCYTRQEARKWEKFYKSGVGREKVKRLMTGSGAAG